MDRPPPHAHSRASPPVQEGSVAQRRYANRVELKAIRRDLRNLATPAEKALWQILKGSQLHGRKFRRQHSVRRHVLDFYCPSEGLAVEVDGSVHDDPQRAAYDADRQREMEGLGIRMIRFSNDDVLQTPDMVAEAIAARFFQTDPEGPPPLTPPVQEGD